MTSAVVRVANIESEDGRKSLEQLQNTIGSADVVNAESNGNKQYSNKSLDNLILPLLRSLELQHLGYTAWKIVTTLRIRNKLGPEYIIPILTIPETEPRLSSGDKLCPGSYVYHEGEVDLYPGLTCLFVGKLP
ncbi:hypothetical protein BJX99DRAFT_88820 [Aspergillus californicus]